MSMAFVGSFSYILLHSITKTKCPIQSHLRALAVLHYPTISTTMEDQGRWKDIAVSDLLLSADYILHGN